MLENTVKRSQEAISEAELLGVDSALVPIKVLRHLLHCAEFVKMANAEWTTKVLNHRVSTPVYSEQELRDEAEDIFEGKATIK